MLLPTNLPALAGLAVVDTMLSPKAGQQLPVRRPDVPYGSYVICINEVDFIADTFSDSAATACCCFCNIWVFHAYHTCGTVSLVNDHVSLVWLVP